MYYIMSEVEDFGGTTIVVEADNVTEAYQILHDSDQAAAVGHATVHKEEPELYELKRTIEFYDVDLICDTKPRHPTDNYDWLRCYFKT